MAPPRLLQVWLEPDMATSSAVWEVGVELGSLQSIASSDIFHTFQLLLSRSVDLHLTNHLLPCGTAF